MPRCKKGRKRHRWSNWWKNIMTEGVSRICLECEREQFKARGPRGKMGPASRCCG
jgi:hypothetical protein